MDDTRGLSSGPQDNWCVYMVRCADGTLYTGIAKNAPARVEQHNAGTGAKYTRSRRPVTLVYQENHTDRGSALKREHAIKQLSAVQKLRLSDAQ